MGKNQLSIHMPDLITSGRGRTHKAKVAKLQKLPPSCCFHKAFACACRKSPYFIWGKGATTWVAGKWKLLPSKKKSTLYSFSTLELVLRESGPSSWVVDSYDQLLLGYMGQNCVKQEICTLIQNGLNMLESI